MKWETAREHFPNQWVLLEALEAHTEADKRILDELNVLKTYLDSPEAMQDYLVLHKAGPERELYVIHTKRETPDIRERRALGLRYRP